MKFKVRLFGRNFLVREFIEGKEKEFPVGMNYQDYYLIATNCKNCNQTTNVYIKKGIHFNDIITRVKCINCECRLEKKES